MKGHNKSSTSSCNIHPVEFVEGICPLCLNDRLLVLATLQRLRPQSLPVSYQTKQEPKVILQDPSRKKPIKVSSLFSFFELRHHHDQKTDHQNNTLQENMVISYENSYNILGRKDFLPKNFAFITKTVTDSFISINFEDNRATSWDKGNEHYQNEHCKASWDHQYQHVMLHTKKKEIVPQSTLRSLLTWRKRIRRLLRVISFKNRSRACHLSTKVKDEDNLRRSWLRPLSPTTNKKPPV